MMPSRWGSLAGGACVAVLAVGSWLAWEDLHRPPDETLDAEQKTVVSPSVSETSGGPVSSAAPEYARSSLQHYLSGVLYFQKGDFPKAHDEWTLAVQLDPSNADARAGLARLSARGARP